MVIRNHVYLEFTDEKVREYFMVKIRKYLGEGGINAAGIFESKKELIEDLSQDEDMK